MKEGIALPGACKNWWSACISVDTGLARQTRAELRRASSVVDALGVSATHELNRRLLEAGCDLRLRRHGPDRLALIAVALAHVVENLNLTAAQQFGKGNPKALSALRFNSLVRTKEPRQLMLPLTRALKLVQGKANVSRLATDLYWWNDRTRTEWCFDYHGEAKAKPNPKEIKP